jgi:recombination protein RecR
VVENIRDVMSIENTSQYNGLYHVLGGIISPIDGIGPSDLTIEKLESRVREGGIDEVILALSTTMEGDTTNFYIYKRLKDFPVKVSALARGLAIGDELEYADEITLGRSIVDRTPFEATFGGKKQGNSI